MHGVQHPVGGGGFVQFKIIRRGERFDGFLVSGGSGVLRGRGKDAQQGSKRAGGGISKMAFFHIVYCRGWLMSVVAVVLQIFLG